MAETDDWGGTPLGPSDDWGGVPVDKGEQRVIPPTQLGRALLPITSYPETYGKMKREALQQAERGVGQLSKPQSAMDPIYGVGNVALGGLGYAMSPISAGYRTVVGQPIQDVTGIPREYTEFTAGLLTPGLGLPRFPRSSTPQVTANPPRMHPTGAILSEGQATGNLPAIQREQAALRGVTGEKPQAAAKEFMEQQGPQVERAHRNVAESLDPFGQVIADTPQAAADLASRSFRSAAASSKSGVDAAYGLAKALPGELHADVFRGSKSFIKDKLSTLPEPIIVDNLTPRATSALDYIEQQVNNLQIKNKADWRGAPPPDSIVGVTLKGVEQWRKNLSAMRRDANANYGNNATDARAMNAIVDQFDDMVDAGIKGGMFSGDPRAIKAWSDARAAHADYKSTFGKGKNDPTGRVVDKVLGNRTNDPAIANDVADFLYGSTGVNPSGQNLATAKRFQKVLGPASPEWSGVKQGLWERLTERTQGFSPKQTADRIEKFFKADGVEMANFMFTPAQRDMALAYADLQRRLIVPQAGANWSNTAKPIIDKINSVIGGSVGAALGHFVGHTVGLPYGGELVGLATHSIPKKMIDARAQTREARRIAQQMPVLANQMQQWSTAVARLQSAPSSLAQRALRGAAVNLDASLQKLGTSLSEMRSGPQLPAASGASDQQQVPGPPAQQQGGGEVGQQQGFSQGGRVGYQDGGAPEYDEANVWNNPHIQRTKEGYPFYGPETPASGQVEEQPPRPQAEMRSYTPPPSERFRNAIQSGMEKLGAASYPAGHMATGISNLLGWTPVGVATGAADLAYHTRPGSESGLTEQMLAAPAVIPGAKGVLKAARSGAAQFGIVRGQPVPPRNPPPAAADVVAARADTRVSGDIVGDRINTIVPEQIAKSVSDAHSALIERFEKQTKRAGKPGTAAANEQVGSPAAAFANAVDPKSAARDEAVQATQRFSDDLKERHGLSHLGLYRTNAGDLNLSMIEVPKANRKQGTGTAAMREIVDYADQNGMRLTLSPALKDPRHGTTSRSRLVDFYKQFGFVENKGRNKDFSISGGMYRPPSLKRAMGGSVASRNHDWFSSVMRSSHG